VCNKAKTLSVGNVRFFIRASESIGSRVSGFGCAVADWSDVRIGSGASMVFFCDVVFMIFFLLICCASSVYRPSLKSGAPAFPRGRRLQRAPRVGRLGFGGDAVRAIERDAEQEKRDLKTKLPTQKTFNQPFERSEQTNSDRREPIIYCWPSTIGNASRRIAGLAGRSLAAFGHAAGSVTDQTQPRNAVTRFRRRTAR